MIGMGLGSMKSTVNYKLIRFHQTFIPASDGVVTRGCAQHSVKLSKVGCVSTWMGDRLGTHSLGMEV